MSNTKTRKILLLTLVHPDFLPPIYAGAQVLRDHGYFVHILTFDSFVPAKNHDDASIVIESVGAHHNIGLLKRLRLRKKFKLRAKELLKDEWESIISYCVFSFLCGLKIKNKTPLMYIALEVSNFFWKTFTRSPLTSVMSWRAIRSAHKADLLATPCSERSFWLAGRANLDYLPYSIYNTAYLIDEKPKDSVALFEKIVPPHLQNKKIILYTGAVNTTQCIMELVKAFDIANEMSSALVITGVKDTPYCNDIVNFVNTATSKDRVVLFPVLPREQMLALQANAHIGVCLVREKNDFLESKMIAPNKIGEYFSKGLFLLGVKLPYMNRFEEMGIASLAKTLQPDDIAIALTFALSKIDNDSYKKNILNFVAGEFCMQEQLQPVIDFLKIRALRN